MKKDDIKNIIKIPKVSNFVILVLFIVLFIVAFYPIHLGIGQYWDWTFPLYQENVKNIFLNNYLSWNDNNFGSPMSYSSDYFLRLFISLFSFIKVNPETILYFYLVLTFSFGSFGMYLIANKFKSQLTSFLIGLFCFINPAIFYKLSAGHINYFISFAIFIYFVYFLFFIFDNKLSHAIALGLIFGFIGSQIQFFIFCLLFFAFYFSLNYKKFKVQYIFIILILAFLINLVWISNFILNVNNVKEISLIASKVAFDDSSHMSVLNIFELSFSKATHISSFYNMGYLLFFTLLFIFLLYSILFSINKNSKFYISLLFLIVIIFLSLGTFNKTIFSFLYPIFREVGHFAPILVFSILLVITTSFNDKNKEMKLFKSCLILFLFIFLILNLNIFYNNYQKINFEDVRTNFNNFNEFTNHQQSLCRVLVYPFFGQYYFKDQPIKYEDQFPLSNTGYDSFSIYANGDFIKNKPDSLNFNHSIQYLLLTKEDYNLSLIERYNICYIYDFSKIYESNFELYVPSEVYNNDLSIIKNDPLFLNKIIMKNSKSVDLIQDRILKLNNYLPRIYSNNLQFQKVNPTKYKLYINNLDGDLSFLESYHKEWKLYLKKHPTDSWCNQIEFYENTNTTECKSTQKFFEGEELSYLWKKPVFDNSHEIVYDYANGWTIDPEYIKEHYSSDYYTTNPDGTINIELVMYFKPQSYFYLGLLISIITILSCLAYLSYEFFKSKKQKT